MCSIHQPERKRKAIRRDKKSNNRICSIVIRQQLASMETLRSYETAISLLRREKGCDDAK
jgi:hypothetical protein